MSTPISLLVMGWIAGATPALDAAPTFNRDVAPILWSRCANCHREGEVGPFALLTHRDAARRADFLLEVVESGRMPPWKAAPGFGHFVGERHLDPRERQILVDWVAAGAPEGDPADLGEPPTFTPGWQLGEPDLVLTMAEPFEVIALGPDVTRVFVIPTGLDRDRAIRAIEFRPGNRRVVHHARVLFDPTAESRSRDAAEPGPGFHSFGGGDLLKPGLVGWTPGTMPRPFPEGVGKVLPAGSDLLLLVHYHPDGKPEVDRSSIGLYFSETPPRRFLAGIPLSTSDIDIPAGESNYTIDLEATVPADCHAYGVIPHAHYLMRELKLTAEPPRGPPRPLIWIRDWDFDWQEQYQYARPVPLPEGTRLRLRARFDNSDANPVNPFHPPRRVRWGLESVDEMLSCHLQVIPDRPEDHATFLDRWPNNLESGAPVGGPSGGGPPWAWIAGLALPGIAGLAWVLGPIRRRLA